MDPTLCRGQTHGACYNTPGGYQCGCGLGYHAHYLSATGTGSFTCLSEYMFDNILFEMTVVDRNTSLPTAREGNVFTGVCHSVHNWPHAYLVTAHPCWLLGHLLQCGRYASYWKAFLF